MPVVEWVWGSQAGPRHFALQCHHRGATLGIGKAIPTGSPASGPLNHVPLIITVLGDGPVLEWLQRCGFPPWSLAFIPSQRKGGETRWSLNPTNGQHEEAQSWVLTEGIARVLALRVTCARIHWWEVCRSRKVFIMETDAVDRFHAQCASMRCSSSSLRIEPNVIDVL